MRVAVAIPSGDQICADTAMCYASMVYASRELDLVIGRGKASTGAFESRNRCVEFAQAFEATHLLMVDHDMVFPPESLLRLLARDVPIVGAAYRRRGEPYEVLAQPEAAEGLHPIQNLGFGLVLIRMEVFAGMKMPWFKIGFTEQRETVGEDTLFLVEARRAGFGTYCDWDLSREVGHLCQVPLTLAMK